MELKIRPEILKGLKESYAQEEACAEGFINCSEGDNPYGTPPAATAAWSARPQQLFAYPHSTAFQEALLSFWGSDCRLTTGMLKLCAGTIDGIYQVLSLFDQPAYQVLGVAPQFPDFVWAVRLRGGIYKSVPIKNGGLPVQALVDGIEKQTALVYIDNPNNPTGMRFTLNELRAVLERAKRMGAAVLVDEAYGGYMKKSESAICLLSEFSNLLVLRSMSKAWGLASLRAGYIAAGEGLCEALMQISNPYVLPECIRLTAAAALSDYGFLKTCAANFDRDKKRLRAALPRTITMAPTYDACPICLLTHVNSNANLYERMLCVGIKAVDGSCFEGLGKNSVRLRLPHCGLMPRLLEAISALT